jgi:signal peptidase
MKLKIKQRKLLIEFLTIAAILVAMFLAYMGLQFLLATDTPFVAIASGSMNPALRAGDLTIIQGVPPTSIQAGDIIVFNSPQGTRTIHRVTGTQTLDGTIQFRTKGDANPTEEPYWTPEQNVHGRVLYRISYIGWLALDPTIPIIIIVILVIIILVWPEKTKRFRRKP